MLSQFVNDVIGRSNNAKAGIAALTSGVTHTYGILFWPDLHHSTSDFLAKIGIVANI